MGIIENKTRGLDIEQREYIKQYFYGNLLNFFSDSDCKVERHQRHNDPYDFIVKIKKNGKVYTKYIEIKSGNATLSKREKEFQAKHPRSYIIQRHSADSDFHKLKEELKSWYKFLTPYSDLDFEQKS
jgi:hypothetical protein